MTRLRDIPALVTIVGSSAKITALNRTYPTGESLLEALDSLIPPAILVVWNRTTTDFAGGQWKLEFSIVLMPDGELFAMQDAVINGIVTATGQKFMMVEPVADVEPGEFIAQIAERDYGEFVLEYPEILASYSQKWTS